jgi:predicted AlkP superfamily phosphohydrolase/phosphomutase/tetratricopeptide (TPR) repeat protein
MSKKKNKVLLIGWDAADWKIINKLMDNGLMPAMKSVVENGVSGRLATLDPPLSPMLWTSMATGVRPYKHGVLGFVEHDGNGGVRPVSSHSRKVKAIWNMLTMEGYKSNIVGWWPSNPVESINGCMVSNLFQQEKKGKETMDLNDWDMPEGTIYPERIKEKLMEIRVHPHEITGNLVLPFVPQAFALDKKQDKRLTVISKFLAHASTIHGACTELMETEEWDFTAVYHDAIDHFSHAFMKYNPPKMEGLDDEAYDLFKDVVKGAYVFHDMMLDRLLKTIDKDTTVVIVSDHGFHSDHLRPRFVPQVPSGPAVEHAPFGIFVAMGPGIKKGERIYGASILDVTPTILSLFDLPIGRDMQGKPLNDIYIEQKENKYIDSWEKVEKDGGLLVKGEHSDELTNEAALQQLIDLGYVDDMKVDGDPEDNKSEYLKNIIRENSFYLAKSYSNGGLFEESLELLLEIENREQPDFRYLIEIITCAVKTKRFALAEEYIRYIRSEKLISDNYMDVLEAKIQIGLNEPVIAMTLLERAMINFPDAPDILIELGKVLTVVRELEKAKKCFSKSIEIDPDNAYAHHGFGLAAMRNEEYELALEYLLNAVEKTYHYPQAHFHLGECLVFMKEYEAAMHSFEVVENISPELPKTYKWLQDIHEILGNESKAEHYRSLVKKYDLGKKVIITGLPGKKITSILESLKESDLAIGGNTEDLYGNSIDVSNKNWLSELKEKVCFVPLNFIGSLSGRFDYSFIFVNYELENVLDFIQKDEGKNTETFDVDLYKAIEKQVRTVQTWFSQQPNLDVVYINSVIDLETVFLQNYLAD